MPYKPIVKHLRCFFEGGATIESNHIGSFTVIALLFLAVFPASAALRSSVPSQVCSFLADSGLATQGWKKQYDQEFGCASPYKELGSGFPLANNLAYYAEGSSSAVRLVTLVLNVNNRASASSGHQQLLEAASDLSVKATGEQLPQALKDAIKNGSKASQKLGLAVVEVVREDWPTGKGYEVKVIIK